MPKVVSKVKSLCTLLLSFMNHRFESHLHEKQWKFFEQFLVIRAQLGALSGLLMTIILLLSDAGKD